MGRMVKWLLVTLSLVAVLSVGSGTDVALAQTSTPTPTAPAYCGLGGGFRFGGAVVDEVVTKLLGMTRDQIHALRVQGKSLVQIAATKSVSEKQLVDAIMAYKKTQVESRVTAGKLTPEQAKLILERMQQMTTQAVNRTALGAKSGAGAGFGQQGGGTGPGKMNRWAR